MSNQPTRRTFVASSLLGGLIGVPAVTSGQSGFGTSDPLRADRWKSHRHDDSNTGAAPDIELSETPAESWSRNVDDPRNEGLSAWISPPVRSNRVIFYTTDKAIVARGSATGETLWLNERPQACNADAPPAVTNSTVISADSNVVAWDLGSGQPKWKKELVSGSATTPIKASGGTVYVGTRGGLNGGVSAFDINSGSKLWTASVDGELAGEVIVGSGAVYTVDASGTVSRIVGGEIEWTYNLDGEDYLTPVLQDENVVVPWNGKPFDDAETVTGILTQIDSQSGVYSQEEDYLPKHDFAPVGYEERVILSTASGTITGQDTYDTWNIETNPLSTAPILVDDTLVVGTQAGYIEGFESESGERRWRHKVLDEAISGLAAGRNAIFATGKFNSIGGLIVGASREARSNVESLLDSFVTANRFGVDTDKARRHLTSASEALYEGDYEDAIAAVNSGQSVLSEEMDIIASTREKIRTTRKQARQIAGKTTYDPTQILNQLNQSAAALRDQNPAEAKRLADEAAAEISDLEAGYRNARTQISDLKSVIAEARRDNIPLMNASGALNESREAFNVSKFEASSSIASRTRSSLETRIQQIRQYRSERDKMDTATGEAEAQNIQIDDATSIRQRANTEFRNENYGQAAESMVRAVVKARETIDTANEAQRHIDAAETFDPIAPFVTDMAEQLGSKTALERAKAAYEDGKYDMALEKATTARDTQLQARVIIDGGVVTAITGGAVAKRYDALSRVSEFIADSTSNDEIEEL